MGAALLVMWAVTGAAWGQYLQGPWVDEAEDAIRRHRMADVRLVVLDAQGRQAPDATVTFNLVRSAFPLGVSRAPAAFRASGGAADWADRPVLRLFNSVSFHPAFRWDQLQPEANGPLRLTDVLAAMEQAQAAGLGVRAGALLSADPAKAPTWTASLDDQALRTAATAYVDEVTRRLGGRSPHLDLMADMIDHQHLTGRLGPTGMRDLAHRAAANGPALRAWRFSDSLIGGRLPDMLATVTTLRERFIPAELVAVELRIEGAVVQGPFARALHRLDTLDVDVAVVGLEVGGPSPVAAAVNLETVLRTLYAHPRVRGVWFAGLTSDDLTMPHAALMDDQGDVTFAGRVVETLFGRLWRAPTEAVTDARGEARARVFRGVHDVTARLPDGSAVTLRVDVDRLTAAPDPGRPGPAGDWNRILLLQPDRSPDVPAAEASSPAPTASVAPSASPRETPAKPIVAWASRP